MGFFSLPVRQPANRGQLFRAEGLITCYLRIRLLGPAWSEQAKPSENLLIQLSNYVCSLTWETQLMISRRLWTINTSFWFAVFGLSGTHLYSFQLCSFFSNDARVSLHCRNRKHFWGFVGTVRVLRNNLNYTRTNCISQSWIRSPGSQQHNVTLPLICENFCTFASGCRKQESDQAEWQ